MRRLAIAVLGITLSACATPAIELVSRFPVGTERVYALRINAIADIDVPGAEAVERTLLEARSTVEIIGETAQGARILLTIEPLRSLRNGIEQLRPTQRVQLIAASDGSILAIESVDGLPADVAGALDDLTPMLGLALPTGPLSLGARWRRAIVEGEQTGRIGGLRAVAGYDSAIVVLGTMRTLRRETDLDTRTLALSGTEFASTEVAFALAEGFPVRIESNSEGRFGIEGEGPGAGTVLISSQTTLELESAGPRTP